MKVSANTVAVMCCRKLLINVAVALGAKEGGSFKGYVQYLADKGHLPVSARKWIDHIKDKGKA